MHQQCTSWLGVCCKQLKWFEMPRRAEAKAHECHSRASPNFMITSSTPIFDRPATLRSLSSDVVAEAGRTKALTVTLGFMARAAAMRCPREPAAPATSTVVCGSALDMLTGAAQLMRVKRTQQTQDTQRSVWKPARLTSLIDWPPQLLKCDLHYWGRTAAAVGSTVAGRELFIGGGSGDRCCQKGHCGSLGHQLAGRKLEWEPVPL